MSEHLNVDPEKDHDLEIYETKGGKAVGRVRVEIIHGNVIITVEREDESKFGPVSLVVV